MSAGEVILLVTSLLLTAQAVCATAFMLYTWEDEDKRAQNTPPASFEPPAFTFTILLPARHEEAVIEDTIRRTVSLNYPQELVQVLIIVEAEDRGTIGKINDTVVALRDRGVRNVRLLTFSDRPINKPHGLNVGLCEATGDVITIFDAEDEPHPDVLQVVNTVMVSEAAPAVQCGVQLMNYADHWFSALNVLEYFFWFKSRLHYHANIGMVPLGGNTVFVRRDLLEDLGGWDQNCLTEDADLGIRLSAAHVPIRVLYADHYVTREETPPTVSQFVRQRTRWDQGFLQVLVKGDWLRLPTGQQRVLAVYTLSFPLFQVILMAYVPLSMWTMFSVKTAELVAMVSLLPLYAVLAQCIVNIIGLYEFTSIHSLSTPLLAPLKVALSYLPYQWLLSYAALRALWRQLRGVNTWEKTTHTGAHRTGILSASAPAVVATEGGPRG